MFPETAGRLRCRTSSSCTHRSELVGASGGDEDEAHACSHGHCRAGSCPWVPAPGAAQSERGTISGVVTDSTKGALPGVTVSVINTATNQTSLVVSSESGNFAAANLPPGPYRIEATLSGFRTTNVTGIQLSAGASARVDVVMEIGGVRETMNVVAEATLLQTEDARVSTIVSNQLIDSCHLSSAARCAACSTSWATVAEAKGTGASISIGGGQGGGYSASLDGILITTNRNANTTENAFLTPSVEAITEFAVESNGFKPEFGQAAGGAITFASEVGNEQVPGLGLRVPARRKARLEGLFRHGRTTRLQPAQLRGLVGRARCCVNKTFFFTTYEGFVNEVNTAANLLSVPTPEMWNGDFSNLVDQNGRRLIDLRPGDDAGRTRMALASFAIRSRTTRFPSADSASWPANYVAMARNVDRPEPGGSARDVRLYQQQLPCGGRDHEGNHAQVQREGRSPADFQPAPFVSVQPGDQPHPTWRVWSRRPCRFRSAAPEGRVRHHRTPRLVGLDPRARW